MLSYRRTIGLSPCFYSNSCYFSFRNKNVPVQKHFNSIHSILSSSLLLESKTIQPKFYSTRSNNRRKFKKEYNFILKSFKFRERNYFNNHRTYSVLNQNNKIDFPGFKTIKRILLWFILLITGTSFILGTTWFLLDETHKREKVIKPILPRLLSVLGSGYFYSERQVIKIITFLCSDDKYAIDLVKSGDFSHIITFTLTTVDSQSKIIVADLLKKLCHIDELKSILLDQGLLNAIQKLIASPETSITFPVFQSVSELLVDLFSSNKYEVNLQIIESLGYDGLERILFHHNSKFSEILATRLAELSAIDSKQIINRTNGINLLHQIIKLNQESSSEQVLRCYANLSLNSEVSYQLVKEDILTTLKLFSNSLNANTLHQVARCLANLSSNEQLQLKIAREDFIVPLANWALSGDKRLAFASTVALGNLASNEEVSTSMINEFLVIKALRKVPRTHDKDLIEQVSRVIANLSKHDYLNPHIFYSIGLQNLQSIIINITTARNMAITIANMASIEQIASQLIGEETIGWETILQLTQYHDLICQRESARAIANLAVSVGPVLTHKKNINALLHKWLDEENEFSKDPIVRAEAIRAFSSLGSAAIEIKGPRFAEGVFLLFPQKPEEIGNQRYDFDVVFIHGVTGDPFQTWRVLSEKDKDIVNVFESNFPVEGSVHANPNQIVCWPRDWLPQEFPNARIISVGYEIHFSKWLGDALPLEKQSVEICKKLSLAGIGKKPTIWVTHSFGGLLTKELLYYASQNEQFKPILDNTVGVVFFSTPHRGANLAKYTEPLEYVLRGTPIVADLKPDSSKLNNLNEKFPQYASHVFTLSFGENDKTCVGSSYTCFELVSDQSANPGWQPSSKHRFQKLNASHFESCKPRDRNSMQYQLVVQFIRECLNQLTKNKN